MSVKACAAYASRGSKSSQYTPTAITAQRDQFCTLKSAMLRVAAIEKFKIDNAIQLGCSSIADIYLTKP